MPHLNLKSLLLLLLVVLSHTVLLAQTEQYIVTNNDTIHLKTFGSGNPLLIINGGPGLNSQGFEPLAKILGQTQKTIVYDQRGTGKSNISKVDSSTITMDIMLEDIEKIRKHLGIEKWVVLGHSFGGMLASYYASKFPQQIKGLILSSSGGIDMELFSVVDILSKLSETEKDSLKYWTAKVAKGDTSYYARYQKSKFLAPAYLYNKTNVPKVAHRLTQANFAVNRLVFKNMSAIEFDCSEGLKKLDVPVLIIQGKEDIVNISIAQKAHKVFKKSNLVILDKCGHYGWLDQPVDYFNAINKYLVNLDS